VVNRTKENIPEVSIVMCTYNGENYLIEQLNSIAEQTHSPDELIVSDDGSTDNTIQILKQFNKQASFPVRLYCNKKRLGPTKNFEKAISLSNGEIIFFSDQDDIWMPQKIGMILQLFMNYKDAGYVFSNALIVDNTSCHMGYTMWESIGFTKYQRKQYQQGNQLAVLLKHNVVTGATMAFRAKLKSIILPMPDQWLHDEWIALLASSIAMPGMFIEMPLIKYRQHSSQFIGGKRQSFFKQVMEATTIRGHAMETQLQQQKSKYANALERLTMIGQHEESTLHSLKAKIEHLQVRYSIHKHKYHIVRFVYVLKELLTFRYNRFSNGWKTALRDLLL
jgi:glycosyltransferase involved in cell wall biosynthesis